jgi:hypothetical protein
MAKQALNKTLTPNKQDLTSVLERIVDDPVVRRELAQDPVGTLARLGVEVDHDEAVAILERAGIATHSSFAPR